MSISPEELAAFADGELSGEAEARIAAAVAADPDLARQVAMHQSLKAKLAGHFASILDQDIPERFTQLLAENGNYQASGSEVVDLAAARDRREAKRTLPGWGWAGGAIAASLVAILVMTTRDERQPNYADARLAGVLDSQLVASQPSDAATRILLSFRNHSDEFCRAFAAQDGNGIACRDNQGWRFQSVGKGSPATGSEYRMAGGETELMAAAQEMAARPALSAEEEAAARDRGWRD